MEKWTNQRFPHFTTATTTTRSITPNADGYLLANDFYHEKKLKLAPKSVLTIGGTIGFAVGYYLDSLRQAAPTRPSESAVPTPQSPNIEGESNPELPPTADETSPDFLQAINGIGPTYAKRLYENGIRSFAALAASDQTTLVEITKVRNVAQAGQWIIDAQNLSSE